LITHNDQKNSNAIASIAATVYDWSNREKNRSLLKHIPSGWRNSFYEPQKVFFKTEENDRIACSYRFEKDHFLFWIDNKEYVVRPTGDNDSRFDLNLEINGVLSSFIGINKDHKFFIHNESIGAIELVQEDRFPRVEQEKDPGSYEATMPSQIVSILVKEGDTIKENEPLIVVSSMKMESTLVANHRGVVKNIHVSEGQNVEAGYVLIQIAED
jgi:biotin carboxyl carrier protein